MGTEVTLKGVVKEKVVDVSSTEYTTYIAKENQLVVVKDGDNYSLVIGNGTSAVNACAPVGSTAGDSVSFDYVGQLQDETPTEVGVYLCPSMSSDSWCVIFDGENYLGDDFLSEYKYVDIYMSSGNVITNTPIAELVTLHTVETDPVYQGSYLYIDESPSLTNTLFPNIWKSGKIETEGFGDAVAFNYSSLSPDYIGDYVISKIVFHD